MEHEFSHCEVNSGAGLNIFKRMFCDDKESNEYFEVSV